MKKMPRSGRSEPGFSLVATLTMMVLLMVLSVGMLSLSAVSLRTVGRDAPLQEARANARLALMMAIGEVQQSLGPDQRVSADGRLSPKGSGEPANPHWLSVWKTTQENGDPWILRDGENGGLSDLRQRSGWDASNDRVALLVSGNESGIRHSEDRDLPEDESVTLVGEGSLGKNVHPRGEVKAPLVGMMKDNKRLGSYAWWVGDLGARANVATRDASTVNRGEDHHALMLAQDSSWTAFGREDIPNFLRGAMVDEPQLEFFEKDFDNRYFHDFTVWSAGLPVDVRRGGWRRDLTAFLESNGEIADYRRDGMELPGLRDQDYLVGPQNSRYDRGPDSGQASRFSEVSPKFGLLRKWAQRARDTDRGNYETETELAEMSSLSTYGGNTRSVDIRQRTTSHVMPVLVEGSLYYNLSYYAAPAPQPGHPYAMRVHFYPRVVLWNPFNFTLRVPESAIFMHINGSKSVEVTLQNNEKRTYRMYWGRGGSATGGATRGSVFFKMDAAVLEPGESVVWSPAANMLYDERNFGRNRLSPSVGPSPSRAFYQDQRADGYPLFQFVQPRPPIPGIPNNYLPTIPLEWREMVPPRPPGNIQDIANPYTQADDYFMSWKPLSASSFDGPTFNSFPMGRYVSCAYQYGDEDELPVEWTSLDPVPFVRSSPGDPVINQLPDRRTRDGFRMRWSRETLSNEIGSGSLAGTPHLQDAAIGNWNMRASWSFRNPFDNVTDVTPNFFGIYTRDLFDGEVDWSNMNPRSGNGKFLGDPFDQPVRGPSRRILFDVPRSGAEIASLGALQHAGLSEFIWHPTYPLGNSLADPRISLNMTEPDRSIPINKDKGGWNQDSIGYALDGRSGNDNGATTDEDNWAWTAREMFKQAALSQTLIYDLSYELNHSLWDAFFLSSGTDAQKQALLRDPLAAPLPNGRMVPNRMAGEIDSDDLTDFHRAASKLLIDGAFNVNSTSVSAWEALLLSNIETQFGSQVAFPRILDTLSGEWNGQNPRADAAWSGQRVFSRDEIRRLAEEIVEEVKKRGPFLGLSDFVNRRLSTDETGEKGALQAAIDRAGLNAAFEATWPLDNTQSLPDYEHVDHINDATRMEQRLKPSTTAWGALGFLTQADLLQFIGPALSARSDTFRIRAYGESRSADGKVAARAWCEAVVQRTPDYVDPTDDAMMTPETLNETNREFGRRFQTVFFRWLRPDEV